MLLPKQQPTQHTLSLSLSPKVTMNGWKIDGLMDVAWNGGRPDEQRVGVERGKEERAKRRRAVLLFSSLLFLAAKEVFIVSAEIHGGKGGSGGGSGIAHIMFRMTDDTQTQSQRPRPPRPSVVLRPPSPRSAALARPLTRVVATKRTVMAAKAS